jgi:hypothetical protein
MRKRFGLRPRLAGLITFVAIVAAVLFVAPQAFAAGNAGYTSFVDPAQCVHGSVVNCNTYLSKAGVWISGGPSTGAGLTDGQYFFAVLVPGFQNGGFLDGADGNLSDTTQSFDSNSNPLYQGLGNDDAVGNRTFTVSGGKATSYSGTHSSCNSNLSGGTGSCGATATNQGLLIQLIPYDDTTNNGGVYILAICKVGATSPSDCKYDAFKVEPSGTTPSATDLTVTKSVSASFKRPFIWGISKSATPSSFTGTGSSTKSIGYEIDVRHHAGIDYGFQIDGTVTVFNPNDFDVSGVTVTDNNTDCKLYNSGTSAYDSQSLTGQSIASNLTLEIAYRCTQATNASGSNDATATWDNTGDLTGTSGTATSPPATWDFSTITPGLVNACVNVTDDKFVTLTNVTGLIATLCLGADGNPLAGLSYSPAGVLTSSLASGVTATHVAAVISPAADAYFKLTYSKTLTIPAIQCGNFVNTATFTGSDDSTVSMHGSTTATVTLCPKEDGLTIGYWQNKNGQGQINTGHPANTCQTLHDFLVQFNPFKDIDTIQISSTNTALKYGALCGTSAGYTQNKSTVSSGLAGYVYDIVKAANASGASMNAMLKAQMLATALSANFSTTGLASINIDLTKICNMIDSSGGTGTCGTGGYLTGVGTAFVTGTLQISPAVPGACVSTTAQTAMSVTCLLWNAASWSNAGGVNWYPSNNKTTQGLAKNTFDAINNGAAFAAGP